MTERTCRICCCTEQHACVDSEHGPCWWIEEDLCSHCGEPAIVAGEFDLLFADVDWSQPLAGEHVLYLQQWAQQARAALGRASRVDPHVFEP